MQTAPDAAGVTVTGYGKAAAPPDVLRAHFTVHGDAADVSSAIGLAADRESAVATALREFGIPDRDLQTAGMAVHPRHNQSGVVIGYRATHTLTVSCRDVSQGGALLSSATRAGGNDISVDHVGLDIDDPAALQAQAREAAFADARARAEQFAALAGHALGPVNSVFEGQPGQQPFPRAAGMAMAEMASAPRVEAGENTVHAQVTVTWSWG